MQGTYRLIAASFLVASLWAAIWFAGAVLLVLAPLYIHDDAVVYPGNYAPLYLYDGSPYDRIVIEVHYEQGVQPSKYALEHLQSIVHRYTGKAVVLSLTGDITPDMLPASTDYNNISAFGYGFLADHARYRTGWLGGNASMYVLYMEDSATGPRVAGTGTVVGVAFRADAFVVFSNYLHSDTIERTVLVHEAGHLLGLEHDYDPGCVMVGTLVENPSMKTGRTLSPDDYCPEHQRQLEEMRHSLI
jgi:hypothetical protein